jgi:hypothetical protein
VIEGIISSTNCYPTVLLSACLLHLLQSLLLLRSPEHYLHLSLRTMSATKQDGCFITNRMTVYFYCAVWPECRWMGFWFPQCLCLRPLRIKQLILSSFQLTLDVCAGESRPSLVTCNTLGRGAVPFCEQEAMRLFSVVFCAVTAVRKFDFQLVIKNTQQVATSAEKVMQWQGLLFLRGHMFCPPSRRQC